MKQKVATTPNFIEASIPHQEAAKNPQEHMRLWSRNVIDEYKELSDEDIRSKLDEKAFPYAVCLENWVYDLNVAGALRNANAFNAKKVFYVGNKRLDKRATQGSHIFMNIEFLPTIEDLVKLKDQYTFIGVDNIYAAKDITNYEYKDNSLLIFGSEALGLSPVMRELCTEFIQIPMFGSIKSLNAATASGIIMNDFVTKYNRKSNVK